MKCMSVGSNLERDGWRWEEGDLLRTQPFKNGKFMPSKYEFCKRRKSLKSGFCSSIYPSQEFRTLCRLVKGGLHLPVVWKPRVRVKAAGRDGS